MSVAGSDSIWVSRALPVAGAHARFECRPGELTILADEDGNDLGHYEQAFRLARPSPGFQITRAEAAVDLALIERLGFEDRLSVELTIPDYLKSLGLSASEVENVLLEFDLDRSRYLYCSQLPLPAARQLQIFELLRRDWTILFLRDPFQPLNGRWREDLARRLMEEVKRRSAIAVASSVNFIPQSWSGIGIQNFDVGKLCAGAVARATREQEQRARASMAVEPDISSLSAKAAASSQVSDPIAALPTIESNYKVITDFIFNPLADISNILRQNTLAAICAAFVLTLGLIASVAIPNLSHNQALLQKVALDMNYAAELQKKEPERGPLQEPAAVSAEIEVQVPAQDELSIALQQPKLEEPMQSAVEAEDLMQAEPLNFAAVLCRFDGDGGDAYVDAFLALEALLLGETQNVLQSEA